MSQKRRQGLNIWWDVGKGCGNNAEINVVNLRKISLTNAVTPAKAGVQNYLKKLVSGLRRMTSKEYCIKGKIVS